MIKLFGWCIVKEIYFTFLRVNVPLMQQELEKLLKHKLHLENELYKKRAKLRKVRKALGV